MKIIPFTAKLEYHNNNFKSCVESLLHISCFNQKTFEVLSERNISEISSNRASRLLDIIHFIFLICIFPITLLSLGIKYYNRSQLHISTIIPSNSHTFPISEKLTTTSPVSPLPTIATPTTTSPVLPLPTIAAPPREVLPVFPTDANPSLQTPIRNAYAIITFRCWEPDEKLAYYSTAKASILEKGLSSHFIFDDENIRIYLLAKLDIKMEDLLPQPLCWKVIVHPTLHRCLKYEPTPLNRILIQAIPKAEDLESIIQELAPLAPLIYSAPEYSQKYVKMRFLLLRLSLYYNTYYSDSPLKELLVQYISDKPSDIFTQISAPFSFNTIDQGFGPVFMPILQLLSQGLSLEDQEYLYANYEGNQSTVQALRALTAGFDAHGVEGYKGGLYNLLNHMLSDDVCHMQHGAMGTGEWGNQDRVACSGGHGPFYIFLKWGPGGPFQSLPLALAYLVPTIENKQFLLRALATAEIQGTLSSERHIYLRDRIFTHEEVYANPDRIAALDREIEITNLQAQVNLFRELPRERQLACVEKLRANPPTTPLQSSMLVTLEAELNRT